MKRALFISFSALALSACGPEDGPVADAEQPEDITDTTGSAVEESDPEDSTDSTPEGSDEPGFAPSAGDWVVMESELLEDGCGLTDYVDRGKPGTILILEPLADDDFEMTFTTGGEIVSCSVNDEALTYDCDPSESIDQTPADYGMNATIPVTLTSSGQFDSDVEMYLISTVELDCEGEDCGWVELLLGTTFPCEMTMQSDVSAE